jgi:hypothetical protein
MSNNFGGFGGPSSGGIDLPINKQRDDINGPGI